MHGLAQMRGTRQPESGDDGIGKDGQLGVGKNPQAGGGNNDSQPAANTSGRKT